MYTQCSHCETLFKITPAQTQAAGGRVRCCRCGEIFNAMDRLYDTLPSAQTEAMDLPAKTHASDEPRTHAAKERRQPSSPRADAPARGGGYSLPADPQEVFRKTREHTPPHPRNWIWGLGSALLAIVLIAQFTWWMREKAIWYPEGRFILQRLCAVTSCTVPLRRAPQWITILDRDIRSDPAKPGSLLLELTMSNTADHEQPYPLIELSLFDNKQRLVAERRFTPQEYLGDAERAETMMPVDLPIHIEMHLVDPGKEVTGFRFDFL